MSNTTNQPTTDPHGLSLGKEPTPWLILLAVGTETPQYVRLELKTQLTIGCIDPDSGVAPDVDLSPYGARQMGVSSHHIVLHAAQGGVHLRDLGSLYGTTLNRFALDPNKLYRVREGDMVELGGLSIVLQSIRQSTGVAAPPVAQPPANPPATKITPNVVKRVIDYFRGHSAQDDTPMVMQADDRPSVAMVSEPPVGVLVEPPSTTVEAEAAASAVEDEMQAAAVTEATPPVALAEEKPSDVVSDAQSAPAEPAAEVIAAPSEEAQAELPLDDASKRQTQEIPRIESSEAVEVAAPSDETQPQRSLASKWQSSSWIILLAIGAPTSQYLAIEVKGQLTVGFADPESGVSPDLDLSPFGAQNLGVSHRHLAFLATQAGLHIRDLDSRNGTVLNGFLLDPKMLYKIQQDDVLQIGGLRIALQAVRSSTASRSTQELPAVAKAKIPNASPNALKRMIDFLRSASDNGDSVADFGQDAQSPSMVPMDTSSEQLTDEGISEESSGVEQDASSVPAKRQKTWVMLLAIGTGVKQYVRIEIRNQLTIGYADFETGLFSELDLSSLRVQEMGVSRRHAAFQIGEGQLYIRDLGSLNGTTVNGVLLDPKKLYKVQKGDVIELGQLRIAVQSVNASTTSKLTSEVRPAVIVEPPKAPTPPPLVFPSIAKRETPSVPTEAESAEGVGLAGFQNSPSLSLGQEILKRQTLELPRADDRLAALGPVPSQSSPWVVKSRRTVQVRTAQKRMNQAQQRVLGIAAVAVIVVFLITGLTLTAINRPTVTATPIVQVIPDVKASDAFTYFRKAGLSVSNFQVIAAPNTTWSAKEEIRFDMEDGDDKGSMLLLTYDTSAKAAKDAFKASQIETLRKWKIIQTSEFLLVSFPETPQTLNTIIINKLKQFLTQTGRTG